MPLPAWPCTPTTASRASSSVRTAARWPSVRRPPSSRAATAVPSASGTACPRPSRMRASSCRSAFTARSVTNARSAPRRTVSTSSPSRTSRATAASISASVQRPGAWPSAVARISVSGITVRRSSACATARATASSGPVSGSRDRRSGAEGRPVRRPFLGARAPRGSFGTAGARLRFRITFAGRSGGGTATGPEIAPVSGSTGRGGASAILSRSSPSARARSRHSGTSSARPRSRLRRRVCSAAVCASAGVYGSPSRSRWARISLRRPENAIRKDRS